jgi:thioesterase domain-containing protein/acyl carrier protein
VHDAVEPQRIEAGIVRLWSRILKTAEPAPDDNFFESGGSSLRAVQLLAGLQSELGLSVPVGAFVRDPTLQRLIEIAGSRRAGHSSILVPLQSNGDRVPFFFAHAEFGNVFFARELAVALGPEQPMYGLQSLGLHGPEAPLTSIPDMAACYIEAIRSVQPQGPYRIGGFCMGALLALEIACQFQDAGHEVSHLVVFNTDAAWFHTKGLRSQIAYHRREIGVATFRNTMRYVAFRALFRLYRVYSKAVFPLHALYARRGKILPPKLRYVYVAELNYRASWNFRPRRFRGNVLYFQGVADRHRDPLPFWHELASGGVEIHTVPVRMETIFSRPHVIELARSLKKCLGSPGELNSGKDKREPGK